MDTGLLEKLDAAIRPERVLETALELVEIPSPTGETEEATERYVEQYKEAGLDVRVSNPVPNAPNMAAYMEGSGDGPTLQFDGHIDVVARIENGRAVALPHSTPEVRNGVLYGRGAADMKGGLAVMLETARVFAEVGFPYAGRLLFTTHGWHEAPLGHGEGVRELIKSGHCGNAALVAEGAHDFIAVAGRGMAIFTITVSREGDASHENQTASGTPHPLFAVGRIVSRLEAFREELCRRTHELLGPETVFVGQVNGGDFYNRFPTEATIVGTRRWHPERSFEEARDELDAMARESAEAVGTQVDVSWQLVRPSYELPPNSPIIDAARFAFRRVKNMAPRIGGVAFVGDAATLAREGGVHALWFGPESFGVHGDLEWITQDEMVDRTRMFLAATVSYFNEGE